LKDAAVVVEMEAAQMHQTAWTRFGSLCETIGSILKNKEAWIQYCKDQKVPDTISMWDVLVDMQKVLSPFTQLTKTFQGINVPYVLFFTKFLPIVGYLHFLVENKMFLTKKGEDYAFAVVSQVYEYVKPGFLGRNVQGVLQYYQVDLSW
jgi:hypothetical protein